MRQTITKEKIIYNSEKEIIGVSLGYDYTAEHEWGIDGLWKKLKLEKKPKNWKHLLLRRMENIYFGQVENEEEDTLYYTTTINPDFVGSFTLPTNRGTPKNIYSFWNESDFLILFRNYNEFNRVKELFQNNEMVLVNQPIERFIEKEYGVDIGGLIFVNVNILTDEVKREVGEYYRLHHSLQKYVENMEEIKQLHNKQKEWKEKFPRCPSTPWSYLDLEPAWKGDFNKLSIINTKYEVIFSLNPYNSNIGSGWLTAEDIEDWVKENTNNTNIFTDNGDWEKVKFENKNVYLSSMLRFYPYFNFYPTKNWQSYTKQLEEVRKILTQSLDNEKTLSRVEGHIKWVIKESLLMNNKIYTNPNESIDYSKFRGLHDFNFGIRDMEDGLIWGIITTLKAFGLGYVGAVNTPAEKYNFSWLVDKLHHEVVYEIIQEGFSNEFDERWVKR